MLKDAAVRLFVFSVFRSIRVGEQFFSHLALDRPLRSGPSGGYRFSHATARDRRHGYTFSPGTL
jgi:hypothetical protein